MAGRFSFVIPGIVAALLFATSGDAGAQKSLNTMLTPYLAEFNLPALAAAVVKNGKILAVGAVGTRRTGEKIPVTLNDRFHIGSDTKAMTALLISMFVEQGRIGWNSTMAELFPEMSEKMDAKFKRITVEQLLSHSSGVSPDNDDIAQIVYKSSCEEANLDEMRYSIFRQWCARPLESEPGGRYAYANMNYLIAGVILERLSGRTWEELIFDRLFVPMGLKSAGIGPQASIGKIDAPVGHWLVDGKPKAFLAGPAGDVPPVLSPAGAVHMSVLDFAQWAAWNAGEGKRKPALVKPETLRKLHTPVISIPVKKDAPPGTPGGGKYALGWGEAQPDWARSPLVMHGGSNEKNLAIIFIDPGHDFAVVLLTNIGGAKADEALKKLAPALYKSFAAAGPEK